MPATRLEELQLDSGDIVLFNRRCMSMSPYGAFICAGAKIVDGTKWDHIGVVVKDSLSGELLLLEAALSGVKLRPLGERLQRSAAHEIAIRRLEMHRTPEFREAVNAFVMEVKDTPYEESMWELLLMAMRTPSKFERESLYRDIVALEREMSEIERDLNEKKLTSFQVQILSAERLRMQHARETKIQWLQQTDRGLFERKEEKWRRSIVCSELVSALYQRVGILPPYPLASSRAPKDFSSQGPHLPFCVRGVQLMPEIFVKTTSLANEHIQDEGKIMRGVLLEKEYKDIVKRCLQQHLTWNRDAAGEIEELLSDFEIIAPADGEILYSEGDDPDYFYVLLRGHCDFYVRHAVDNDSSLVATYGPSNELGEGSFIHNMRKRRATAQVRGNALLARVKGKTFAPFIARHKMEVHPQGSSRKMIQQVLSNHPLFKRLTDAEKEEAASACYRVTFPEGADVIRQGDYGERFYIIESGVVDISVQKPGDACPKVREKRSKGECFGEASLIYNSPRGATARVVSKELVVWSLDRNTFTVLTKGGSNFLPLFFKSKSSVFDSEESFMTWDDLLAVIGGKRAELHGKPSLDKLVSRLILSGSTRLVTFSEFIHFDLLIESPDAEVMVAWRLLSKDSGFITKESFCAELLEHGLVDPAEVTHCSDRILGDKQMCKADFLQFMGRQDLPLFFVRYMAELKSEVDALKEVWFGVVDNSLSDYTYRNRPGSPLSADDALRGSKERKGRLFQTPNTLSVGPSLAAILAALGATAVARSVVAPLERIKLIMQTRSGTGGSMTHTFKRVVETEGLRSLWRGNGANIIRLVPSRVIQVSVFSQVKEFFNYNTEMPSEFQYVLAGGVAGIASCTITFPLDLVRTRLTVQQNVGAPYSGLVNGLRTIVQNEGLLALYKGFSLSLLGIFPYVGLNYSFYEFLKPLARNEATDNLDRRYHPYLLLTCGTVAAAAAQIVAFPFDTVRHKVMVSGMWNGQIARPQVFKNSFEVVRVTYSNEGWRGFYTGLVPNLLKVVPAAFVAHLCFNGFLLRNTLEADR